MQTLSMRAPTWPVAGLLACLVALLVTLAAATPALTRADQEPVPGIDITLTQRPGYPTRLGTTNDAGQVRRVLGPGTYTVDIVDPRQIRVPVAITVNVKGVRGVTSATLPPFGSEDWQRYAAAARNTSRGYVVAKGGGAFQFTVPPGKPLPVAITVRTVDPVPATPDKPQDHQTQICARNERGDVFCWDNLSPDVPAPLPPLPEEDPPFQPPMTAPAGAPASPPPGADIGAYEALRDSTAGNAAIQGLRVEKVCTAPEVWNPELQACQTPTPANCVLPMVWSPETRQCILPAGEAANYNSTRSNISRKPG